MTATTRWNIILGGLAALLLPLGGCLDARQGADPHATPDPVDPNQPVDPIDPIVDPPPETAWCGPLAEPHRASWYPVPSAEVLEPTCALRTHTWGSPNPSHWVQTLWRLDGLWYQRDYGPNFATLVHFEVDEDGHFVAATRGRPADGPFGVFFFAPEEPLERIEIEPAPLEAMLDPSSWRVRRVLHGPADLLGLGEDGEEIVIQRWEGERLVERVERGGGGPYSATGPFVATTTWTYDGEGRLVGALADAGTGALTASYAYDEAGRPLAIERAFDGAVFAGETWRWSEEGALLEREHWVDYLSEAGRGARALPGAISIARLDDFAAVDFDWASDPWRAAVATPVEGRSCHSVPRGPGHGYPGAEGAYDLGMPVGERPHNIGWAYGNLGYGYGYGTDAWYGHGGVHSLDVSGLLSGNLHATVRYDAAGRMVEESLHIDRASWAAQLERERTYAGALLIEDRMVGEMVRASDASALEWDRALRWTYDDRGHLAARALLEGDLVLEHQAWEHDADGRWLLHEVHIDPQGRLLPLDGSFYGCYDGYAYGGCAHPAPNPEGPRLSYRYERVLDAEGRPVLERETEFSPGAVPNPVEWSTERDAEGRIVAVHHSYHGQEQLLWDEDDNLLLHIWFHGDGHERKRLEIDYDSLGRWIERRTHHEGHLPHVERRRFACG